METVDCSQDVETLQARAGAKWIWTDRPEAEVDRMAQFRLVFDWDGQGEVAWTGFADTLYTIWCNGAALGVGPVAGVTNKPYLTRWELTPQAKKGRNVLALQVWSTAGTIACGDVSSLVGGVIGWLEAGETIIPTGTAWRARDAAEYNRPPRTDDTPATRKQHGHPARAEAQVRLLLADMRGAPLDWMEPGYDERGDGWRPARVVHPFDHPQREGIRMSPIPPLTCELLPQPRVLDAGWASGGRAVRYAFDVAPAMWEQQHESLLCPQLKLRHPPAQISPHACGLPDPARLGWDSLALPWDCPQPAGDARFYLTLDLGRQTSGCLLLDLHGREDCRIDVGYADHLTDRRVNPVQQFHCADSITVSAGRRQIRFPHDRGCRYIQISLSAAVRIDRATWEEHVYPHDRELRFDCSDPALNAVWQAAVDTLRQVSLWGYVDNAWRERHAWLGPNLLNASRGGFAVAGDLELTRKNLIDALQYTDQRPDRLMAAAVLGNNNGPWHRVMESHDLTFPQIARDYLLHSNDRQLAPALADACDRLVAHQAVFTDSGLKAPTDPERTLAFSGWNFNAGYNAITAHNLLFIEALRYTAQVHRFLGRDDRADDLVSREGPLVEAIFRELIEEKRGVLCQGLDAEDRCVPFCSQHDNARALALGIVPAELVDRFRRYCGGPSGTWPTNRSAWQGANPRGEHIRYHPEQMVVASSPFESFAVIDAIAACESSQAAINYIRYNFGAMADEGPGTLWECWTQHLVEDATCSYSQSWGVAVAYQILRYALGARVVEPGGAAIEWRPHRVRLERIRAKIRSISGDVTLGWDGRELYWQIPAGVRVILIQPDGQESVITGKSDYGRCDQPMTMEGRGETR